jgi:hypothetical protein
MRLRAQLGLLPAPVLPALVSAALVLAGCGSGALSISELRTDATRICLRAGEQTGALGPPSNPAVAASFLSRGIAVLRPELRALRALRPPGSGAEAYAHALSAFAGEVNALATAIAGLRGGADPVLAIQSLQRRLAPLEAAADGAWRLLRIPACLNG